MTTQVVSDTQRRFIAAIGERVPLDRVEELYLFAPLRQGGMETGVAVVAVARPVAEAEAPAEPALEAGVDEAERLLEPDDDGAIAQDGGERCDPTEAAAGASPAERTEDESDGPAEIENPALEDPDADPSQRPSPRCTVFTARYRLQLKGAERGRWETDIVEEADAPLVTVDAVVRGVQRRSGDLAEVERLAPADLSALLTEAVWPRTT